MYGKVTIGVSSVRLEASLPRVSIPHPYHADDCYSKTAELLQLLREFGTDITHERAALVGPTRATVGNTVRNVYAQTAVFGSRLFDERLNALIRVHVEIVNNKVASTAMAAQVAFSLQVLEAKSADELEVCFCKRPWVFHRFGKTLSRVAIGNQREARDSKSCTDSMLSG